MRWRATPHLVRLVTLGSVVVVAGLVLGRAEIVAVGTPLLAALVPGLLRRAPSVTARLVLAEQRVLEGEVTQLSVLLSADGRVDQANVDITLRAGLAVVDGATRVTVDLRAGGSRQVTVEMRPTRWGVHRVGPAHVTAYARGRLVVRAEPLAAMPLRVLPRAERFAAASPHPFTRVVTGSHVARTVAQYAGALYFSDVEADVLAPLVAAAVLLFVEAGDLAIAVPAGTALDRSVVRGRLLAAATSVTLAVAVSAATLALAALGLAGSTAVRAAGLAGAALAVAAPILLFRAAAGDRRPGRG